MHVEGDTINKYRNNAHTDMNARAPIAIILFYGGLWVLKFFDTNKIEYRGPINFGHIPVFTFYIHDIADMIHQFSDTGITQFDR